MQFGFWKQRSAELQLLQTIHDLTYNLNQKSQTDMILLDFSKAFDKVSHRHLLLKLNYYGFRSNILNWITSFLTGRTQSVVCGGCTSIRCNVLSGVPQGSVLVYIYIYINDIVQELSSICRLYADDCILYRRIDSFTDVRALQDNLQLLELWEKKWKMSFNIDKCMVISITLKQTPIQLITPFMENNLLWSSVPNTWGYQLTPSYLLTSTWTMCAKRQTLY